MEENTRFDEFIRSYADQLRAKDASPKTLAQWRTRREFLRMSLLAAMGVPNRRSERLTVRKVAGIKRDGFHLEHLLINTFPDVWMTANAWIPEGIKGRVPAVLCVHGHWAGARRDPAVQRRCLGLVKLGFFVLSVDAFSAGERHPANKRGSYHGALLGSALWPAGLTLSGVQVYENRLAVDYLQTRPEVDGEKIGITGASGGGNQSMYAGALDERIKAVVPVCSVGAYRAYLRAACCVCEVVPGALTFTEEGDVLGLVAPRALMVINATKDAFQFSVAQAKLSVARAEDIFSLYGKRSSLAHAIFEAPHDYNKDMREAMYGFMTRHLKGEGDGKPIAEPKFEVEKEPDLACWPEIERPATLLTPLLIASREANRLLSWQDDSKLDHKEAWQTRALLQRSELAEVLGPLPSTDRVTGTFGKSKLNDGLNENTLTLDVEPGITLPVAVRHRTALGRVGASVLLHQGGREAALKLPIAKALIDAGKALYVLELRATGSLRPQRDAVAGSPDHNSTEHALWVGRPLAGQWVADVSALVQFLRNQAGIDDRKISLVGVGQASLVALLAGVRLKDVSIAMLEPMTTFITQQAYPAGTSMGLLVPGLFRAGDIPQLLALAAPSRVIIAGGLSNQGKPLDQKGLNTAFAFTRRMYGLLKASEALMVREKMEPAEVAKML
jgi:dienelactone hydrolase